MVKYVTLAISTFSGSSAASFDFTSEHQIRIRKNKSQNEKNENEMKNKIAIHTFLSWFGNDELTQFHAIRNYIYIFY
jgi:hypothetical protein